MLDLQSNNISTIPEDVLKRFLQFATSEIPLEVILKDNPVVKTLEETVSFSDTKDDELFFYQESKRFNIQAAEMKGKRGEMVRTCGSQKMEILLEIQWFLCSVAS
jgi:hypothetical protein